jgi:CheY-like chemotaxis protein
MQPPVEYEQLLVYVVDDSPAIRARYEAQIAEMSHVRICGWAANAKDAVQGITLHRPDLVILDITLDGSSGIEVLNALRQQQTGHKPEVFVVSVENDPALHAHCLQLGASHCYDKAEGFVQFLDRLQQLRKPATQSDAAGSPPCNCAQQRR